MRPFRLVLRARAVRAVEHARAWPRGVRTRRSPAWSSIPPGASCPARRSPSRTTPPARTFETVSNTAGAFSIPALDPGTYTSPSRSTGSRPPSINDVRLLAATPGNIRATLEVGQPRPKRSRSRAGPSSCRPSRRRCPRPSPPSRSPTLPLVSRNALNFVVFLPGVETTGGPARLDDQRPAAEHDQRHLRRRQREQQLPVDRRLLLDGHAAARRGRRSHGHRARRRRADQAAQGAVQISFVTRSGTNNFDGSIYHYFRHPRAQLELLLQQDPRPRAQRRHRPPVRRPARRADRHPRSLQRPRQGVLLLQHGGVLSADRGVADAHDPAPARAGGMVPLQRHRRRRQQVREVNLLHARGSRTASSRRSTRSSRALLASIRTAAGTTGTITDLTEPEHAAVLLPERRHEQAARADRTRRRQPVDEPPAERLLLLAAGS